jgi:Cytochrome P460
MLHNDGMRPFAIMIPMLILACDASSSSKKTESMASSSETKVDPSRIPDASSWKRVGEPRPSFAGPHRGSFQRVMLNDIAERALHENRFKPWPEGSQLVKEALDDKGRRVAWFWMSKEQGDWVWVQSEADGRVNERLRGETSGACAACHTSRAASFDGVFTPVFVGKGRLNIPMGGK